MAFLATINVTFDLLYLCYKIKYLFLYIYIIIFKLKNVMYLINAFYCNSSTTIL